MRWTVIQGGGLQETDGGSGQCRSILTRLSADGAMLWRAGLLSFAKDTSLPPWPHHERVFTPLADGSHALALALGDRSFESCKGFAPIRFPGEWPAAVHVDQPVRAFEVVADRRFYRAEVSLLRLEAGDPVQAPDAPEVLIHCLEGEISTAGDLIGPGDSLLGPGPAAPAAAGTDGVAIMVAVHPLSGRP